MRDVVKSRQAWEDSLPRCVSICRYFPAFRATNLRSRLLSGISGWNSSSWSWV